MAWIESHQTLSRHRKTLRAAGILQVDRHKLIGHLHELWWWGVDNAGLDGCLGDLSDHEIAEGAQWDGDAVEFVQALISAGFVDVNQETDKRFLHDWYDYAGKLIERRNKDRERKAPPEIRRNSKGNPQEIRRSSNGIPPDVRRNSCATVPYRTKEEEEEGARARDNLEHPKKEGDLHWAAWYQDTFKVCPTGRALGDIGNLVANGINQELIIAVIERARDTGRKNLLNWAATTLANLLARGITTFDQWQADQAEESPTARPRPRDRPPDSPQYDDLTEFARSIQEADTS